MTCFSDPLDHVSQRRLSELLFCVGRRPDPAVTATTSAGGAAVTVDDITAGAFFVAESDAATAAATAAAAAATDGDGALRLEVGTPPVVGKGDLSRDRAGVTCGGV